MPADPLTLAFDTAAAHCAAALVQGDTLLAARTEPMQRGQAERLVPLLAELLAEAGKSWDDLDLIAVGTGPGNFTGLRIAVATARGLALGRNLPAVGVSLFESLAESHPGPVLVTLDDRRGGFFAQRLCDGMPEGAPIEAAPGALAALGPFAPDTLCLGFRAAEVASELGLAAGSEAVAPDPLAIARHAARRHRAGPAPRPAPLYIRHADALPSSEPPTLIFDDA